MSRRVPLLLSGYVEHREPPPPILVAQYVPAKPEELIVETEAEPVKEKPKRRSRPRRWRSIAGALTDLRAENAARLGGCR